LRHEGLPVGLLEGQCCCAVGHNRMLSVKPVLDYLPIERSTAQILSGVAENEIESTPDCHVEELSTNALRFPE